LQDAGVEALSADRRFATACNAALQSVKIVIACSGYRVVGAGHHLTTFDALEIAMGSPVSSLVAYFDTCRRKRNQVDYDRANAATETEAEDLLQKAEEFRDLVEQWIRTHHPRYAV
jgi:SAV_6107-like HEPN